MRLLFLGVIIESDSSPESKQDYGHEAELKLLKYPISLNSLVYKYGDTLNSNVTVDTIANSPTLCGKSFKFTYKAPTRSPIKILKEPLSIDEMKIGQKYIAEADTSNVRAEKIRLKKKSLDSDFNTWKQNALTLFEFSYVFPFIYSCNKYKCVICDEAFTDADLLRTHSINDHVAKDYTSVLDNRVKDKNLKVDVTSMQCRICEAVSSNIQSLKVHLQNHGKRIDPNLKDNIIPFKLGNGESFLCQICDEAFNKLRVLIIHMNKHFNNYSCEICGSSFMAIQLLRRHLQTHKVGSFSCEQCSKVFSNASNRNLHVKFVHRKQYSRACPLCPERFNSYYKRTQHLRVVHNRASASFKCETCGKEYGLKYQLLSHKRSVHMLERNHECGVCHARFFSKYFLSTHMVKHTGEKNYKCEDCSKSYMRKRNLREHMKSHQTS